MLDNTISALEAALELEHKAREALPALIAERDHLQKKITQLDQAIQRFGGFKDAGENGHSVSNGHAVSNGHSNGRSKRKPVARVAKAEKTEKADKTDKVETAKPVVRRGRPPKNSNRPQISDLVLKTLRESKDALHSTDIVDAVKKASPAVPPNAIHGAIFRLKNSGKITAQGRAKDYRYSIAS